MILSKQSLYSHELVGADKAVPMLNNVHVSIDGTVVSSNSQGMLAIEPVRKEMKDNIPLKDNFLKKSLTITLDSVKELIKNLPKDTLFKGLLEYVSIQWDNKREHFFALITDGHREQKIELNVFDRGYIKFGQMFKKICSAKKVHKIVVNRKRLIKMLQTIDKVCPDKTEDSLIFIELTDVNGIILKSINHKNGQRCLGVMNSYKIENIEWPEPSLWEKRFNS